MTDDHLFEGLQFCVRKLQDVEQRGHLSPEATAELREFEQVLDEHEKLRSGRRERE